MFSRRALMALAVCAVLMSSTAFAGSGGTKKDSTISVRNDSSTVIAVFVDPDQAKIDALPDNPTQGQIQAAGGKLVNPGSTQTFKVNAGTYTLAAGSNVDTASTTSVTVGRGQTARYAYTGSELVLY